MPRWRNQRSVVGACLLALVVGGCTSATGPSPSPVPTSPIPSPSGTENAQEREERVAYEAAEKSYRDFISEYRHVTGKGGAKSATATMRATAAGPYLLHATKVVKAYESTGSRTTGRATLGYLRRAGYSPTSILIDACEDETGVRTFDSKDRQIAVNGIRVLRLDVRRQGDVWKVWSSTGSEQKACE